jgi:hypothetical protein
MLNEPTVRSHKGASAFCAGGARSAHVDLASLGNLLGRSCSVDCRAGDRPAQISRISQILVSPGAPAARARFGRVAIPGGADL